MLNNRKIPLMKLNIIHSIKGRIRLRSRAVKYLGKEKNKFESELNSYIDIEVLSLCSISGSILIKYDQETYDSDDIIEIVERQLSFFALLVYSKEREEKNSLVVSERKLQDEPISEIAQRILISFISLVYFGVKSRGQKPQLSLIRKLFQASSLISLGISKNVIESGVKSLLIKKRPNADTLTMSAIITAILAGKGTTALTTILLSDVAELMTAYTMGRTRNAIKDLLDIGSVEIFVVDENGNLKIKDIKDVKIGDIASFQAGDKISVDGSIVDGNAYIDQSPITGEYMPVNKSINEEVFAGTIIKSGNIRVKVEKAGDNTTLSRIVTMVEDASSKKAQVQAFADKFSANFIPVNFILTALVYAITKNVDRAVSMLVIDYSCGIRLATTTALSAYIHNSVKNGVLVKGGNYVELLAQADTLVLDKTGTVTEGKPKLMSIYAVPPYTERQVLEYAGAAEDDSSHPIAQAILQRIKKYSYKIPKHGLIEVAISKGVKTTVDTNEVIVGNKKYMLENNINMKEIIYGESSIERKGEAPIYIALNKEAIGILGISDSLKENMKKSLNRLRNLGFDDIRLLTGDIEGQAEKVANKISVDDFKSDLMPEDKAESILELQSKGAKVMMVGDGINDAPALAYADVGVCIGNTSTDVAIETASVTIINDNFLLIPSAVFQARETMKTVKQNFFLVLSINSVGLFLSAVGLLPLIWGSVLHNSSTIFVVLNSGKLLLRDYERREGK